MYYEEAPAKRDMRRQRLDVPSSFSIAPKGTEDARAAAEPPSK